MPGLEERPDHACLEARDVVLSSRVRLARNFADMPFPGRQNDVWAREAVRRVSDAIAAGDDARAYGMILIADLSPEKSMTLVERHLISPDLLERREHAAVVLREDRCVSVMVNEEDHVRIQAILPGLSIGRAMELADAVDDRIDATAPFAYDPTWGYLTACPTNAGTGLRASVMLHLPAMAMSGQVGGVVGAVGKLGMTVRGLYGEGSEAMGNLFQLSNQITLGRPEHEIAANLEAVARQLIARERQTRRILAERSKDDLENRLMRSLGALLYARKMDIREFMRLWSDLWLACELGWVDIDREVLRDLFVRVQTAHLEEAAGTGLSVPERDIARARVAREILDEAIPKG